MDLHKIRELSMFLKIAEIRVLGRFSATSWKASSYFYVSDEVMSRTLQRIHLGVGSSFRKNLSIL